MEFNVETLTSLLPQEIPSRRNLFPYFAATIVNLMMFVCGIAFAWTSPSLPKLSGSVDSGNNPLMIPITGSEGSWIAGLLCLGGIIGPPVAGYLVNKVGRKVSLILLALLMIVSWLIIAFAKTVILFYIARFIMGVVVGSVFIVVPMFLGEISEDHNRGAITSLVDFFDSLGVLFVNVLGPILTIQNFALVCLAPLLTFLLVFFIWIPETPHFLASTQNYCYLKKSLLKYKNQTANETEKEIEELLLVAQSNQIRNRNNFKDLIIMPGLRKAIIMTLTLITLQQFSGISAVNSYLQTIFTASGTKIAPEVSSIFIAAVQVCTTFVTSSVVDRFGRKILILMSLLGCCTSLSSLGIYFFLQNKNHNTEAIFWLPIASMFIFFISFRMGLGPLPWTILADLFPSEVRAVAATLTSINVSVMSFLVLLLFPSLSSLLGMAQTFWFFATICLCGSIFVYILLPETKGKSLEEIQHLLEYNHK